ncbi:MAG: PorV/PorQ family protein [Elusimicrobia bacterium]|nr:PorV/PorQ family protein [Elusimicrobiota bacterium]
MKRALLAAALALAPSGAFAAAAATGAVILRRPMSARVAALGGAFSSAAAGVSSLGVNPAGLSGARRPELESTFNSGVADDAFGSLAAAVPVRAGVAAAGIEYYDAGSVDLVDASGAQTTVTAERDYVGLAGWAMPLGGGLSAGVLGKFYNLTLADAAHANGFAADAGARWKTPVPGLDLGASVRNDGPGAKFEASSDPLPLTERGGASWTMRFRPARDESLYARGTRLTLSAEGVKVRDERPTLTTAGEFALDAGRSLALALRLGWTFDQYGAGLSAGLGVREGRFTVDYALSEQGELGSVQFVSLGVRL